jgi:hypothetical protein
MTSVSRSSCYREPYRLVPEAPRTIGSHARYLLTSQRGITFAHRFRFAAVVFVGVPAFIATAVMDHSLSLVLPAAVFIGVVLFWLRGASVLGEFFAGRRKNRVYRLGCPIRGRVVEKPKRVKTKRENRHPIYRLAWQFDVDGTTYSGKLEHGDRKSLRRLYDGSMITVLYDPANPAVNTPWIDEQTFRRDANRAVRGDIPKRQMSRRAHAILLEANTFLLWFGGFFCVIGLLVFSGFASHAIQRREFSFWVLQPLVFVAMGGLMFYVAVRERIRTERAYVCGEVAEGRIVSRDKLTFGTAGQQITCVSWAFEVEGVTYAGSLLLNDPNAVDRAFPEADALVLYDPDDPMVNSLFIK